MCARLVWVVLLVLVVIGGNPGAAHALQKNCTQEMRDSHAAFMKELRARNFESGAASGSGQAAQALTAWLKSVHKEVVQHEEAHKKASGKWAGKIEYFYYTWWNIPYAVAGCHMPKPGRPLEVSLKAALAPKEPSKGDLRNVEMWKKEIEIKKAREQCHRIGAPTGRVRCLAQYSGYDWLDNYPLR